ncbi:hypothetical protein K437DRAFT_237295 [Tilletiaria anomala UBC 951]|uniref:Actin-crosslinking protein n=1 Tax=Tilletiaria anomala (strain ATCC 24038 / CBS 436.72 / UBC 951) TaxID=1037660 RepID=A0A066VWJ6_TILAU|nr:uncharacterized protein K437DRAFT_237295 [Tilletiaria anomala UBC 951]KDN43189.1 hypothetical protein K437DRAFT_237295 [Tilletiaria anomala UBC 951]
MPDSSKKKSMRLSFKGEAKKKHKPRSTSSSGGPSSKADGKRKRSPESDAEEYGGDEQAWVPAESAIDVNGPCFLFQELQDPSSSKPIPYTLQFNSTLQSIVPISIAPPDLGNQQILLTGEEGGEEAGAMIAAIEVSPTHVHQVWVANRVAGSTTWSFKSGAEGRFIGADKHGAIHAESEARGPQEGWEIEPIRSGAGGLAVKSAVHGRYLTLGTVAGGKTVLRADADRAEECAWQVRVQWKYRHQARQEARAKMEVSSSGLMKRYDPAAMQAQGGMVMGGGNKPRSAEILLEMRAKKKSDRYAK